jgi:hypothetical protein
MQTAQSWSIARLPRAQSEQPPPQGVLARAVASKRVWASSFVALGVADFGSLAQLTSQALTALQGLGAAGGAGLIVTSASALKRSRNFDEVLDAANGLAWGGQGLLYLVPRVPTALRFGLGLGLVGSAMQTAVGVRRLKRGLVARDAELAKLGALDIGGGLAWLSWDLFGVRHPIFVSAYVVAKVGRETYANRAAVVGFLGNVTRKAKRGYVDALSAVDAARRAFEDGVQQGLEARITGGVARPRSA